MPANDAPGGSTGPGGDRTYTVEDGLAAPETERTSFPEASGAGSPSAATAEVTRR